MSGETLVTQTISETLEQTALRLAVELAVDGIIDGERGPYDPPYKILHKRGGKIMEIIIKERR